MELTSSLRLKSDFTPIHFRTAGQTYRFVNLDLDVEVYGNVARVIDHGDTSRVDVPRHFFTTRG